MGKLAQGLACKEGEREVEIDSEKQLRGLPIQSSGGDPMEADSSEDITPQACQG